MVVDVVLLPEMLKESELAGKTAVIFDVLRATTTMTAALAAGVAEVRVQPSLEAARKAAGEFGGKGILCGESRCLKPNGFDLGNSPGAFSEVAHRGRVVFMATTNGTKAILAAAGAAERFVGALVNATAVGEAAMKTGRDVVLLCAGTDGALAMEDVLGAGAVATAIVKNGGNLGGDAAWMAVTLFQTSADKLEQMLSQTHGGRNVIQAELAQDVTFAARHDVIDVVGRVVQRDGGTVVTR
jgi:2-phosphosulfolactate phosphatase